MLMDERENFLFVLKPPVLHVKRCLPVNNTHQFSEQRSWGGRKETERTSSLTGQSPPENLPAETVLAIHTQN